MDKTVINFRISEKNLVDNRLHQKIILERLILLALLKFTMNTYLAEKLS